MTAAAAGPPPVSVIVASRHRPQLLMRALEGLAQQDHPALEVVVVADPAAAAEVAAAGWRVKLAAFDEANLAAARNLGLSLAAAPVAAFLDDDAAPEPTWAARLAAPFADPAVTAACGFVRGRSGMAWQWRAATVTAKGFDRPLDVPEDGPSLHRGSRRQAVKLHGTNCAVRTAAALAAGGFDPAFRFYLEDADLSLRLAGAGGVTAVVPGAVVHHAFAESVRRRADRAPRDLADIGRSLAVFLRRHAGGADPEAVARHRAAERRRALAHMVAGRLEPRDVAPLLATFEAGLAAGLAVALPPLAPRAAEPPPFLPLPGTGPRSGAVLAGRPWRRARLEAEAAAARAEGRVVTLVVLGPGLRPHRMVFGTDGIWRQTGGQFGRGERGRRIRPSGLARRIAQEVAGLATIRPVAP